MSNQPPIKAVVYCQRCGLSQIAMRVATACLRGTQVQVQRYRYAVRPCAGCHSTHFHGDHPNSRIPNWRWPGLSPSDKRFLRSLRIPLFATLDTIA